MQAFLTSSLFSILRNLFTHKFLAVFNDSNFYVEIILLTLDSVSLTIKTFRIRMKFNPLTFGNNSKKYSPSLFNISPSFHLPQTAQGDNGLLPKLDMAT